MTIRIFVPRDSTALALGADEVADTIAAEAARRHLDVEIVRNGTRGLLWLEPLVEVATPAGRVGFGPVDCADVAALFDANFHLGECRHALALGLVEQIALGATAGFSENESYRLKAGLPEMYMR
jgi:formate dehydrogenase iron-sulfur subunit